MASPGRRRETDPPSSPGWVARSEGLLGALLLPLCRGLARLLVRTFYRRVDVVGLEHVPATGPILIASTHPNGLIDALLILATLPRRFVPIAAAPQFRWPLYGTLLPVGLVYHRPATFRAGSALVRVGRPVPVRDLLPRDGTVSAHAVHALTARLADALRALTIQAGDRETLELLAVAEACWRAEVTNLDGHPTVRVAWMQAALRVARQLPAGEQPRVETLRHRLVRYRRVLARVARGAQRLPRAGSPWHTGAPPIREALMLLLELPFVVGGCLRHLLPYLLTTLLIRIARPEPAMEATWKVIGGLVLYPLCWLLEALVAWHLGGPWLLAGFLAWLIPGGIWLLAWHGRLARIARQARGAVWTWRHAHRSRALLAERRAIVDDMRALAAVVDRDEVYAVAAVAGAWPPAAARASGLPTQGGQS